MIYTSLKLIPKVFDVVFLCRNSSQPQVKSQASSLKSQVSLKSHHIKTFKLSKLSTVL